MYEGRVASRRGLAMDAVAHLMALKACVGTGNEDKGRAIHGKLQANGMASHNAQLVSTLIDFYYGHFARLSEEEAVYRRLEDARRGIVNRGHPKGRDVLHAGDEGVRTDWRLCAGPAHPTRSWSTRVM